MLYIFHFYKVPVFLFCLAFQTLNYQFGKPECFFTLNVFLGFRNLAKVDLKFNNQLLPELYLTQEKEQHYQYSERTLPQATPLLLSKPGQSPVPASQGACCVNKSR